MGTIRCARWLRFCLAFAATFTGLNSLVAQDPIVPPDAKLEKLFESRVLTEGAAKPLAPFGLIIANSDTDTLPGWNGRSAT